MALFATASNKELQDRVTALELQISQADAAHADEVKTLTDQIETMKTDLEQAATLKTELETATGNLTVAESLVATQAATIATLTADLDAAKNSTAQQAVEIAAAAGVSAPLAIEGGGASTLTATITRAEFNKLDHPSRNAVIAAKTKIID